MGYLRKKPTRTWLRQATFSFRKYWSISGFCFSEKKQKTILMCFDKYEYQLHTRYGGVGLTILVRELSPGLEISIVSYGEENDSFNKKKNI